MKPFRHRALSAAVGLILPLCAAIPAHAADTADGPPPALRGFLYDAGDFALRAAANGLAALLPPAVKMPARYTQSPDFLPGMGRFIDAPEGDKKWSVGYSKKTLIPGGYFDEEGNYIGGNDVYMGGSLEVTGRKNPEKLLDDQAVRVTALSDGSGRGIAVFASIDGYALSLSEARAIRALLREFSREKNIISINIGVLHQHSCIDILGMNGPLVNALFLNPLINLTPWLEPYTGRNAAFMENLRQTTAQAIREAVKGMKPGTLYYGTADASKYIRDKRPPQQIDPLLHRFRFRPDDGSKETWLVNYSAHCVGLGADTRQVSADYPHYMEQEIGSRANFQMIQGAQLAVTVEAGEFWFEGAGRMDTVIPYGRKLGRLLIGITGDAPVAPILNVRAKEVRVPLDNPLHLLLFRYGMIETIAVKRCPIGPAIDIITETGYMELGRDLAVAFAPGELEPCLAFGGSLSAAQAWSGRDFEFTPMKDQVRGGRKLLVFGIMNDHSGYYLLPNDIHSFVLFGNEEINTVGIHASEKLLGAFGELMEEIN